eukprot:TRINITY_DN5396_c0_g1_i1.p1 TRINITY_DN5396_c0_g1~~TRINITY_DN5396_c0_g1_i1.p1  ORF type:complete len:462 (+),score=137.64 TRINITY_DN5396_c0_g1_i1:24-1388(+)
MATPEAAPVPAAEAPAPAAEAPAPAAEAPAPAAEAPAPAAEAPAPAAEAPAPAAEAPAPAAEAPAPAGARTLAEEMAYVSRLDDTSYEIRPGFVEGMRVPGRFFVNPQLEKLVFGELELACERGADGGGFLPAVKQIANVATLPGIVSGSLAMPDLHSGYGFAIGNVAAFDMDDPEAVVSPGGVGFDINCGVRLLRTNLTEADVADKKELLAQTLFDHIPVGVGSQGIIPTTSESLCEALELGMDWSLRQGYAWPEDKEHCEEYGRMPGADASKVSARARKRGLPQLGTLGAGNHYAEIQVVDEIFEPTAARKMGIDKVGQVVVMIHSGSRGLGHQVATDALQAMESAMARDNIKVNDRQLACARISSPEGQDYLASMAAAANYAWVNRSTIDLPRAQALPRCSTRRRTTSTCTSFTTCRTTSPKLRTTLSLASPASSSSTARARRAPSPRTTH